MRSTIWKKTLICLGAVLFLESPAVGTAFAYTVKAENTDAEADARNRSIGNSDYRRTERQQEVLMAAFAKIKDLGVFEIADLVKDVLPMVTTDLSLWDITGYAMDVMNIGTDEIASYRIPEEGAYTPQTIDGMQVLVPDLEQNRQYLQQILYHAGE